MRGHGACQQSYWEMKEVLDSDKDELISSSLKHFNFLLCHFINLSHQGTEEHTQKEKKRNINKPAPVISVDFSLSRLLYGLKNFFSASCKAVLIGA